MTVFAFMGALIGKLSDIIETVSAFMVCFRKIVVAFMSAYRNVVRDSYNCVGFHVCLATLLEIL